MLLQDRCLLLAPFSLISPLPRWGQASTHQTFKPQAACKPLEQGRDILKRVDAVNTLQGVSSAPRGEKCDGSSCVRAPMPHKGAAAAPGSLLQRGEFR